ncbi:MAG: hypothetical protein H0X18_06730 [Geodermatophilaceae bacterium]|nr:hypothetical protein [Geodermatophilaceae bacterium]
MPIPVATWNVWWRFGDWAARRLAIVETVRPADPDILCIQEGVGGRRIDHRRHLGFEHRLWAPGR